MMCGIIMSASIEMEKLRSERARLEEESRGKQQTATIRNAIESTWRKNST